MLLVRLKLYDLPIVFGGQWTLTGFSFGVLTESSLDFFRNLYPQYYWTSTKTSTLGNLYIYPQGPLRLPSGTSTSTQQGPLRLPSGISTSLPCYWNSLLTYQQLVDSPHCYLLLWDESLSESSLNSIYQSTSFTLLLHSLWPQQLVSNLHPVFLRIDNAFLHLFQTKLQQNLILVQQGLVHFQCHIFILIV